MSIEKDIFNDKKQAIKSLFGGEINTSFLIRIKSTIEKEYWQEVFKNFDIRLSFFSDGSNALDIELCRYIVGCHKSKTLFLSNQKRNELERSDAYCRELIDEVLVSIKLRKYGGRYLRPNPITTCDFKTDLFLYFPVVYDLFVIVTKSLELLDGDLRYRELFKIVYQNLLSALVLLENSLFDNVYPLVRGSIEAFLKLVLIMENPECYSSFNLFVKKQESRPTTDINQDREFEEMFNNKKTKRQVTKDAFLNFGWLDEVKYYHEIVRESTPYSIYGIGEYLKKTADDVKNASNTVDLLLKHYKQCNIYAHGNSIKQELPVQQFLTIIQPLVVLVPSAFIVLCDELKQPMIIEEVDIQKKILKDTEDIVALSNRINNDTLNEYYNVIFEDDD